MSGGVWNRRKEIAIGRWRETYTIVTCSNTEENNIPNGYVCKEILQQDIKTANWFLLVAYAKMQIEMNWGRNCYFFKKFLKDTFPAQDLLG